MKYIQWISLVAMMIVASGCAQIQGVIATNTPVPTLTSTPTPTPIPPTPTPGQESVEGWALEPADDLLTFEGDIQGVAVSPTTTTLAVADGTNTFSLINLEDASTISTYTLGPSDLFVEDTVHFSANGQYAAVGTFSTVSVFNVATGELAYEITANTVDVAVQGTTLYVLTRNEMVAAYNMVNGFQLRTFQVDAPEDPGQPQAVAALTNGTLAFLVQDENLTSYLATLPAAFNALNRPNVVEGVHMAAAGTTIAVSDSDDLTLYTTAEGEDGIEMEPSSILCDNYTAIDITTSFVLALAGQCGLHLFDAQTGEELVYQPLVDRNGITIALSETNVYLAVGDAVQSYTIVQPEEE